MAKKEESKEVAPEELVTDKQLNMINELYSEVPGYPKQYELQDLETLSKEAANKHIQLILAFKNGLREINSGQRVNGFEKISYAMIYKLCFRLKFESTRFSGMTDIEFIKAVYEQYRLFHDAGQYAKQKIAEEAEQ